MKYLRAWDGNFCVPKRGYNESCSVIACQLVLSCVNGLCKLYLVILFLKCISMINYKKASVMAHNGGIYHRVSIDSWKM